MLIGTNKKDASKTPASFCCLNINAVKLRIYLFVLPQTNKLQKRGKALTKRHSFKYLKRPEKL